MKKHEQITHEVLEACGFKRVGGSDLLWSHAWLYPKNLLLSYGNDAYNFRLTHDTYQGIGRMNTVEELAIGFKFVSDKDLFELIEL